MLTKHDLDQIEQLVDKKLDEKIKYLPTKIEFFQWMDKIMGELQFIREEITVAHGQLDDHENRVTSLEKIHPN